MMKSLALKSVLVAVLLCGAAPAAGDPSGDIPVEFKITRSRDSLLIGEELVIAVTAIYPAGTKLHQPAEVKSDGRFLMKEARLLSSKQVSGSLEDKYEFVGSPFVSGAQELPDLEFVWHDSVDSVMTVFAKPGSIFVKSVLPADTAGLDIKDIVGPQELPGRRWLIAVIILAAVGSLAAGYWLYKRRLLRMPLPDVPAESPYEIALRRLNALAAAGLIEKGNFKQYYIELTLILRNYIEGRFGIAAIESTTLELKRSLRHDDLPRVQADAALSVLMRADLVKFAKYLPDANHANSDFDAVKSFIMETKPVAVEVEVVK